VRDDLLRSVRSEILEHLHFTEKETDIYKIHQSGDLANLDGLDDSSLSKLPSLLALRNALYSSTFREYISEVASSGPLSGKKTDMAINMYTPGCHLLCHDDVIGSRRLSYILYLTDPDIPWKPEWGGALRLYPTEHLTAPDGVTGRVPSAEFSVSIPPAWNQLSFFTIQPGESFHDVEEVYRRRDDEDKNDGGRMRMAISGWFHIPQKGEEGYEEGLEEKMAETSSRTQLRRKGDIFDLPEARSLIIQEPKVQPDGIMWTERELDFLVKFIHPTYLIPDTLDELRKRFNVECSITLSNFLNPKFAANLRDYISSIDGDKTTAIPARAGALPGETGIARPPHKQRFLYRHAIPSDFTESAAEEGTPLDQLLDILLPSSLFTRWLRYFTDSNFDESNIVARRFRRGHDYTLANTYDYDLPQLEFTLSLTPTLGWNDEPDDASVFEGSVSDQEPRSGTPSRRNPVPNPTEAEGEFSVGGYEVYMTGDDDEEGVGLAMEASNTGAGQRRKADPAVYQDRTDIGDEAILISMPASWNTMTVVLRDQGLLRFVKYVSKSANGDKWDIVGTYPVVSEIGTGLEEYLSSPSASGESDDEPDVESEDSEENAEDYDAEEDTAEEEYEGSQEI
jgi:prolyl 3-hydroxylase /prolyl 3,4-dihydroxylase